MSDIAVPIGVERLVLDAAYGGQSLAEVMVPAPDGVLRAAAIADAVAAVHAWDLWRTFLTASVGSHDDGEAWTLLLRELWGDGGSAPAPAEPATSSWLVAEVSRPLPEPARDRLQRIVVTVGGATLGTLALAPARRPVPAQELRRRIEALGGFELCRLAVREGLIGRPLRSGDDLRTRLRAAAGARETVPHDVADASPPPGIALAPGWQRHAAQALDGEAAGFVIARRRHAAVGLSGSRVAVLPRAAGRELLASARTAGDVVVSIGEPGEDAAVVYAPGVVWSDDGASAGDDAGAEQRAPDRARRAAAALRRRLPSRDGEGELTHRLPILMYHRVAPGGGDALRKWRVTPSQLEAQLHHLREAGFRSASFGEWRSAAEHHAPLPGRRVMITFDDGYEDFAEHAHPLLRQYELDAMVFLVSDRVGGVNAWDREHGEVLPLMDWETIRELDGHGVSFGGHTASHPRLTRLSPADVAREASRCRATLAERLGHPVTAFSYPFGDVDPAVSHLVGACGFSYAVTTMESRAASVGSMLELPRLTVLGTESHDAFVRMLAPDD